MKTCKKFFSLALVLLLCLAMAVPALAAEGDETKTLNLTMKKPTPGHTYSVYQIFTGDVYDSKTGTDEKTVFGLANVKYGQNYLPDGVTEDTLVPESKLQDIMEMGAEAFANQLMGDGTETNPRLISDTPVATLRENNWSVDVAPGYYLIVDEGYDGVAPEGDTNSAYMVEIVGDVEITPKTTVPTIDKEVETKDGAGNKIPGYAIGESFQFKLTAHVPVDALAQYKTYWLTFHDTMSAGITFEKIDSVTVTEGGKIELPNYTLTEPSQENKNTFSLRIATLFDSIGTTPENWPTVSIEGEDGKIVDVVEVVVTYSAHLNENAKITDGSDKESNFNDNDVYLEYSNDPYNDQNGGKTPPDKVKVYSFQLDITKYANEADPNDLTANLLAGAGFTLYLPDSEKPIPLYSKTTAGITSYYAWMEAGTPLEEWGWTRVTGDQVVTDENGHCEINGLKPGTYTLKETKTPEGFNTIGDMTLTITAEYSDGSDTDINLSYTLANSEGEKIDEGENGTQIKVINKSGTLLPSTGGMGTTLLYVVGGLLVVGAAVILVVRKSVRRKS